MAEVNSVLGDDKFFVKSTFSVSHGGGKGGAAGPQAGKSTYTWNTGTADEVWVEFVDSEGKYTVVRSWRQDDWQSRAELGERLRTR